MIRSAEEELTLRDYRETDAAALSRLALAGFKEFQPAYSDWAAMSASISQMPSLAAAGELIIAEAGGTLLGAVAYIGPERLGPVFRFSMAHHPDAGRRPSRAGQGRGACIDGGVLPARPARWVAGPRAAHQIMTAALAM